MRKVLFLTTMLALILTSSVWAADVSGTWSLKMQGPMGEENFDIAIKADGENLAVTAAHPFLNEMKGAGTLKGDAINFKLKATGDMPVEFTFTGKVTGDKKMAGTSEIGGFGGGPGGQAPAGGQGNAPAAPKGNGWTADKK